MKKALFPSPESESIPSSKLSQNLQNHIAILIDSSGSMKNLLDKVREVFKNQVSFLRKQSLDFSQETRVSVYSFSNVSTCLVWDMDVTRLEEIPKFSAIGGTALMDCVNLAVKDLKEIPQKYGDHAFIVYLLTDGEENSSVSMSKERFSAMVNSLPDNFTLTAMVPDNNAVSYLTRLGFSKGNIDKWESSDRGVEEVGRRFENSMRSFYSSRSVGLRSTSSFMVDTDNISVNKAKNNLSEVTNPVIVINPDNKAIQIRELVEKNNLPYVVGHSFYELVKPEHIQPQKSIAIQNKKTGRVYEGKEAREMIGLPDYEIKVAPGNFGEWVVFVQSTSVNRNIIPKQRVLVLT